MQITQENLLDWIANYRWMVETIEEARHRQSDTGYIGAKIAQYGVESSLPKASGGTSDPVFNEVSRRVMGVSQRIQRYEYKVQQVQQRISLVRGDREIEVLHRLLDGDSMRSVGKHMGLSEATIKRIRDNIIDQMVL